MAAKVIGVYLTLSYIFLSVLGELQITPEQFADFQGTDPTTNCGCDQKMQNFCNEIMKKVKDPNATGEFQPNYPRCMETKAKGKSSCGGGSVEINPKVIVCAWVKTVQANDMYYTFGKGQKPNHVMYYTVSKDGSICYFTKDIQYP